jgi:hypothetical protein
LIQKKQDFFALPKERRLRGTEAGNKPSHSPGSKAYFPAHAIAWTCVMVNHTG